MDIIHKMSFIKCKLFMNNLEIFTFYLQIGVEWEQVVKINKLLFLVKKIVSKNFQKYLKKKRGMNTWTKKILLNIIESID